MHGLETIRRRNDEAWVRYWAGLADSLERLDENYDGATGELAVGAPALLGRILTVLDALGRRSTGRARRAAG